MPTAKLGQIGIYYEIHGAGEDVVLISGFANSRDVWFRQVPELSRRYRVISFDNRGCGRSAKPHQPCSMEQYARDTAGLLDALGIAAAHICGVSLGGMVAQEFTLQHPGRVRSLVLACTSCGGRCAVLSDRETIDLLLNRDKRNGLTREEWTRQTLPYSFTQEFIDSNPEIIERYVSMRVKYWPPPHSMASQVEALMTHDTCDRLPRIQAPTLVISGSADRQVPVANSKVLASDIPDARLVILEGMGHGFLIEAADAANRTILDFLARHAGALPRAAGPAGTPQPAGSA